MDRPPVENGTTAATGTNDLEGTKNSEMAPTIPAVLSMIEIGPCIDRRPLAAGSVAVQRDGCHISLPRGGATRAGLVQL